MKKELIFLAGFAAAVLSACTKSDEVLNTLSESLISFEPVVANVTKANYVTNGTIEDNKGGFNFSVYAWYTKGNTFDATTAIPYMDNVAVTIYDEAITDETDGKGAWKPATTYYWPKNGNLVFEAYSPADAFASGGEGIVKSTAKEGLTFTNYVVKSLDKQIDLLYSDRTLEKTSSKGNNGGYAGVDIAFKHALSAIEVKAKTNLDYNGAIKIKNIKILNAYNTGDFAQNLTDASPAGWSNQKNEVNYELLNKESVLSQTELTWQNGDMSNAIILPQSFNHDNNHVSIKVEYAIKYGSGDWLAQESTFDLTKPYNGTEDGNTVTIKEWEIGKKYIYTLTFTLDTIYFAPDVTDWKDVYVNDITVE